MFKDGYSYPEYSYPSKRHDRKSEYAYACETCGTIIKGYYMYKVKGHVKCWKCRAEEEKEKRKMLNVPRTVSFNNSVNAFRFLEKLNNLHVTFELETFTNGVVVVHYRCTDYEHNFLIDMFENLISDLSKDENEKREMSAEEKIDDYFKNLAKISLNSIYGVPNYTKFGIEKVIFNNPATIVFWLDGTKTVVKCQPGDIFDCEKGLAMCFAKKAMGNKSNYNDNFKRYIRQATKIFYDESISIPEEE